MSPSLTGRGGIGLDIGTSAVRAAEVRAGRPPVVTRFGQVLLPDGAMVAGEVQDPGAVAQALSTLWKRAGFSSKGVRVGVSNQRVVVRAVELPVMPRDEVAGAIQFQGQELGIPIDLSQAIVDFEVMEEFTGPEGQPMQKLMVVAAQRQMIDALLSAVEGANLRPEGVEHNPYPLVRAVAGETALASQAEAVIDIGAGVSDLVVHLGGRVRFVRPLGTAGDDLTQALVTAMDLDWSTAETVKHQAGPALATRLGGGRAAPPPLRYHEEDEDEEPAFDLIEEEPFAEAPRDDQVERAAEILQPDVQRFVDTIWSSLDYYALQPDEPPVGRVLLSGGGALAGGLIERLSARLRVDVEAAHAFARVKVGKVKLTPAQVDAAEPFLGVAIGLALGALED